MPIKQVVVDFTYERDTKTKVRFKENTDGLPAIGVLYLNQQEYEKLGKPEHVKVTILAS